MQRRMYLYSFFCSVTLRKNGRVKILGRNAETSKPESWLKPCISKQESKLS